MNKNKKVGRPTTPEFKKKQEKIFVNLTVSQKKQLVAVAENEDLSLSQICLKALKKAKYLPS